MTDNEIIKALECCVSVNGEDCKNCPYENEVYVQGYGGCCNQLSRDTLDLINRQKTEIERLQEENKNQKMVLESINDELYPLPFETDFEKAIRTAKSEAIEEFAERLKRVVAVHNGDMWSKYEYIDNLVKEMEGESK